MNDTPTLATSHEPPQLSRATRLVNSALERVARCTCDGPPSVAVLRGFDQESRALASRVQRRLRARAPEAHVSTEPAPVVATFGTAGHHRCAVVDATGRGGDRALIAWRWQANQPERGRLALRLDDGRELLLEPGQGVEVRPRQQHLEIDVLDQFTGGHLWATATSIEVEQLEGLHLLHRDEVFADDAPAVVRIAHDGTGAARRVQ